MSDETREFVAKRNRAVAVLAEFNADINPMADEITALRAEVSRTEKRLGNKLASEVLARRTAEARAAALEEQNARLREAVHEVKETLEPILESSRSTQEKTVYSIVSRALSTTPAKVREADNSQGDMSVKDAYNELIMAVGKKWPGETRHETALRYIRQAEEATDAGTYLEASKEDEG